MFDPCVRYGDSDDDRDDSDDADAWVTFVSYQQSHSMDDLHSRAPISSLLSLFIVLAHGTNPASASMCGKIIYLSIYLSVYIDVYIDVYIHLSL